MVPPFNFSHWKVISGSAAERAAPAGEAAGSSANGLPPEALRIAIVEFTHIRELHHVTILHNVTQNDSVRQRNRRLREHLPRPFVQC